MSDDLDAQLIAALQQDGRASYSELAARVGAPRTAVSARVQALLGTGAVEIVAVAHPQLLGLTTLAHVSVAVSGPADDVVGALCATDASVFVTAVSGAHDLVAELRVSSDRELYDALAHLRAQPRVRAVNTLLYTDVVTSVFMPQGRLRSDVHVDETDLRLIELLERDGRMPFVELAHRVGMSPSAARARVSRLVTGRALHVAAVVRRGTGSGRPALGVGLNLGGDDEHVTGFLARLPGVEFVARTVGRFDLVITLGADSTTRLHRITEQLKALDEVHGLTTWAHLEVFKEHYSRGIARTTP
ncbi:Lrp/AsnC family transcriptional regulator [Streptomyces qinglanensis]|uniref:DNA-binding transcriptional regulator, Lrp family n=1 Tax=Streptomyces qinglanensis TaxID=943816 RepID=A0A1H9U590_9ACTN|nr:Lrp/AsnC family transcriptional regulator [Streptomyces qinglanensis]SES04665.1 DNA-binding transcriptional regulator, Lrp family [Streptomyces qinglanensis]